MRKNESSVLHFIFAIICRFSSRDLGWRILEYRHRWNGRAHNTDFYVVVRWRILEFEQWRPNAGTINLMCEHPESHSKEICCCICRSSLVLHCLSIGRENRRVRVKAADD